MFLFFLHLVLGLQLDFSSKHDNNYQAEKKLCTEKTKWPKAQQNLFFSIQNFYAISEPLSIFCKFF